MFENHHLPEVSLEDNQFNDTSFGSNNLAGGETQESPSTFFGKLYLTSKGRKLIDDLTGNMEESTQSKTYGMVIMGVGLLFIGFSTLYLPFVLIAPKSFCFYFSAGSSISIIGLSVMLGHRQFCSKLFGEQIKYFTMAYIASLIGGIYFSSFNQNYFFALLSVIVEVSLNT